MTHVNNGASHDSERFPIAQSSLKGSQTVAVAPSVPDSGIGLYYSTDTLASSGKRYLVPDDVSDGKQHFGVDENAERGNWSGRLDFLLSCLGYAVGLGNVWRFPYLCYRNGGGAFLIPYAIMLCFVGIPLFFLELSLGQFSSNGPLTCWGFLPLFRGIGVAQLVISALVCIYYNMIIGWSLYYLASSFTSSLPWASCDNWWNTWHCKDRLPVVSCMGLTRYDNGTCYNGTHRVGLWNSTVFTEVTKIARTSASEEFYNRRALNLSEGVENMGSIQWQMALALTVAWIIAFFCMIKGIKSSGKVVYFTAIFPYVVLVILFFRGVTLPNAWLGLKFYIVPDMRRLLSARVWTDAAVQIFFSLSLSSGGLITLASYNRFHNPVLRDTLIVSLCNCGTSIFAGFVVFSYLGFMAGKLGTDVADVVADGPGLAFVVYPSAVTKMPISPLWAILFFLMLLTLGLDSQFAMLETVLTSFMDKFPSLRAQKTKCVLAMCFVLFMAGLILCTRGGAYMLQLMDTYSGGWALLIIGLLECVGIGWIYGSSRFFDDIRIMINKRPSIWWKICWQYISPTLIVGIIAFAWIDYSRAKFGKNYYFPIWADVMGWFMTFSSIMWIPIIAIYLVWKEKDEGSILRRVRLLSLPTREWGPALVKYRKLVDYVVGFEVDPWGTGTKKEPLQYENYAMSYTNGVDGVKPVYGTPSSTTNGSISNIALSNDRSKSQLSLGSLGNLSYESGV